MLKGNSYRALESEDLMNYQICKILEPVLKLTFASSYIYGIISSGAH